MENRRTKQPWSGELCLHVRGPEKDRKNNPYMDAVYSVFCQKKKQNHRFLSLVTIDCKPDSRKYLLLVPN